MIDRRLLRCLPAALLVTSLLSSCRAAGPGRYVSAYAGPYTDNSLPEEIALFKPLSCEDATLVALSYGEIIGTPGENYRWEWEGNFVQWFGEQDHQELGGLLIWRWLKFPWDTFVDTSFAFGNGLSWATEDPALEEQFHPDTGATQLLYHIAVELAFELPFENERGERPWQTFVRVHHRSGVFGTFGDVDGGSNVLALGLRFGF